MDCQKIGCEQQATTAVAVEFYPPKAVMKFYRTNKYLSRMIVGIEVCDTCFSAMTLAELFPDGRLADLAKPVERGTGTAVDLAATKLVRIAFTDPEYLRLVAMRKGH